MKYTKKKMGMKNFSFENSSSLKDLGVNNNGSLFEELEDGEEDISLDEEEGKNILENETSDPAKSNDYYEFKLCGKKNIRVNRSLFTFRITQFIWYGGGILPSLYFGIFLKQRGLTLIEFSSIFSLIFIFQFMTCFVAGIIADKMGNAKPVLMFLMLSSCFFLVSLILTPNINNISCKLHDRNLNKSELSELRKEFRSCFTECTFKNKNHISYNERNSSLVEELADSKSICNFFNIQITNTSLDSSRDDCCNSCVNSTKVECIKERNGYIVVLYALFILAYYSVYSTTYRFMNFSAVSLAEKTDSDFGKELAVGRSADLLVIVVAAFVLNIDKASGVEIDFTPIFWIGSSIMFTAFLTLFMTEVPILPPGKDLMKKGFKLISNTDILAFILLVFVSGNGSTFYYTFHLVFLETMNASSTLVALHSIAIVSYGLPVLLTSQCWLEKFGTNKMFLLGFLFRVIHFTAYSYIPNPWWTLIADVCLIFSEDLFWVAVVKHCWTVAPVGFAATFVATTGSVHYGIGRSSGVFFGGMMMNYLGQRMTYRIMAAIFFVTALLYSTFLYKRRKSPAISYSHLHNEW